MGGIKDWVKDMKNALLKDKSKTKNVIAVDWSKLAGVAGGVEKITYITPYENTIPVAKKTANIIKNLVKWNGLDVKTVTLIGHSLGAHTAGDTGMNLQRDQEVGEKPGKIIGMDPAGPGYRGITVPVADILNDGKNNDNDNSDKDRRLD